MQNFEYNINFNLAKYKPNKDNNRYNRNFACPHILHNNGRN